MDVPNILIKYKKCISIIISKNEKGIFNNFYKILSQTVIYKGIKILICEGFRNLTWKYKEREKTLENRKYYYIKDKNYLKEIIKASLIVGESFNVLFPKLQINPDISIVIPISNKLEYTLKCLKAISLRTKGFFEVVVVDDSSDGEMGVVLQNIKNLIYIKNEKKIGYLASCNRGVKDCKGQYIFFLNDNFIVTENWIEPLKKAMTIENVGAAGVKIVYPDGILQEAGGIIWNESSLIKYGKGDNPSKPEYNFLREVDYCSGAALIVKKDLFQKLGGFNPVYKKERYAEMDLCFSLIDMGYKIIYQPQSLVINSNGKRRKRNKYSLIKKWQLIDKGIFLKKWNNYFLNEYANSESNCIFSKRIRRKGRTILVLDRYVPLFDKDSGSYRMWNLLKILVELDHKVVFIGDDATKYEPYTTEIQQLGVEVIYFPYFLSIERYLEEYGNFFDIVILSRVINANKYFHSVKKYCSNSKIIFDTVDLHFLRESRRSVIESDERLFNEAEKTKQLELELIRKSDLSLVVSQFEFEILKKEDSSLQIEIVSNIHIVQGFKKSFRERENILFLGNFEHIPNLDGIKWFLQEIYPSIRSKIPNLILYIVGNDPSNELIKFSSKDIVVTGYVQDVEPFFSNCRVFVAPLRYGAGVKGKINHSMSYGLPVVTTSIGAEGMDLVDGKNALISDHPIEFARKVVNLYYDPELWELLSLNSIQNVLDNFSYEKTKKFLRNLIDKL